LEANQKELRKMFAPFGTVDKIWFRSLALDIESPEPHKAKIIKKMYGQ